MELQSSISDTTTTISVDSTTGLPGTTPFTLVIDPGSTEEIVTVTGVSGTNLTVTRGQDGSAAQAHASGAVVRHMATARDFREPQEHMGNTVAHGTTGAVVGTTDTQALTHKDLTSSTNTFPSTLATDNEVSAAVTAHAGSTTTHGVAGSIMGTSSAQTVTNKDLSSSTNTFPSSLATTAALGAHIADTAAHAATGGVVGASKTQTLTNKTISGATNAISNIAESSVTGLVSDLAAINAQIDQSPVGEVAYAQITVPSTGTTSATPVNVTGLSITYTLDVGRKYKLTAWLQPNSTVQGDRIGVLILSGGATQEVGTFNIDTGTATATVLSKRINAPTSGLKTFQVQIYRPAGTGTVNIAAGTNGPSYIMLEDIGPAS
jgi:hypothetical protein